MSESVRTTTFRVGAPYYWRLVHNLTRRDIQSKYQGSLLGILWTILSPIIMLGLYTFVFTVIFQARWPELGTKVALGNLGFAVVLFAGLAVHAFLADVLSAAPKCIIANKNFVKKVVFPLNALPVVLTGTALFHFAVKLLILFAFILALTQSLPVTTLFLPILILPLIAMVLGGALIVSALGVYLRDINQVMPQIVTALLFLGPILYPRDAAPEALQPFLLVNPIGIPVEQIRRVVVFGELPQWEWVLMHAVASLMILALGFGLFKILQRGFSDVI